MNTVKKSKQLQTLHAGLIRPHRHVLERFYLSEEELSEVVIKSGIDTETRRELLSIELGFQSTWGGLDTVDFLTRVLLLNIHGRVVAEVGVTPREAKAKTWYRWFPKPYQEFNPDETAGEALNRLSAKERASIHYMLEVEDKRLSLL